MKWKGSIIGEVGGSDSNATFPKPYQAISIASDSLTEVLDERHRGLWAQLGKGSNPRNFYTSSLNQWIQVVSIFIVWTEIHEWTWTSPQGPQNKYAGRVPNILITILDLYRTLNSSCEEEYASSQSLVSQLSVQVERGPPEVTVPRSCCEVCGRSGQTPPEVDKLYSTLILR